MATGWARKAGAAIKVTEAAGVPSVGSAGGRRYALKRFGTPVPDALINSLKRTRVALWTARNVREKPLDQRLPAKDLRSLCEPGDVSFAGVHTVSQG